MKFKDFSRFPGPVGTLYTRTLYFFIPYNHVHGNDLFTYVDTFAPLQLFPIIIRQLAVLQFQVYSETSTAHIYVSLTETEAWKKVKYVFPPSVETEGFDGVLRNPTTVRSM